jgi:hypothetical protein
MREIDSMDKELGSAAGKFKEPDPYAAGAQSQNAQGKCTQKNKIIL